MSHRPRVRLAALAATTLMLSAPLLTACGFNAATDRVYTPAAGANDREASVDVLNAVIVAAEDGAGNFVATMANNSTSDEASLAAIQSAGEPSAEVAGGAEIPVQGWVNLADTGGLATTGDFEVGQFVPLTLTFDTAEGTQAIDIKVPVVPDTEEFEGLGTIPEPAGAVDGADEDDTGTDSESDSDSNSNSN